MCETICCFCSIYKTNYGNLFAKGSEFPDTQIAAVQVDETHSKGVEMIE